MLGYFGSKVHHACSHAIAIPVEKLFILVAAINTDIHEDRLANGETGI